MRIDIGLYIFIVRFRIAGQFHKAVEHDTFIRSVKSAYEHGDFGGVGHSQIAGFILRYFRACTFGRKANADIINGVDISG